MGLPVDRYGNFIDVSARLDSAARPFAKFSSKFNNIKIDGDMMQHRDLPRYRATIMVDFIDVFGVQQTFRKDIQLVVAHLNFPKVTIQDRLLFTDD